MTALAVGLGPVTRGACPATSQRPARRGSRAVRSLPWVARPITPEGYPPPGASRPQARADVGSGERQGPRAFTCPALSPSTKSRARARTRASLRSAP